MNFRKQVHKPTEEDVERFDEIREEIESLANEAMDIVRMNSSSFERERCKAYWFSYLENAVGCPINGEETMNTTAERLRAEMEVEFELEEEHIDQLKGAGNDYAGDHPTMDLHEMEKVARDIAIGSLDGWGVDTSHDITVNDQVEGLIACATDYVVEGLHSFFEPPDTDDVFTESE